MAVTVADVRHVATLARLELTDERAAALVGELNTILAHMDVLAGVGSSRLDPPVGVGVDGAPLVADDGPPLTLHGDLAKLAPSFRDGLFLVPRLSTHETAEES